MYLMVRIKSLVKLIFIITTTLPIPFKIMKYFMLLSFKVG